MKHISLVLHRAFPDYEERFLKEKETVPKEIPAHPLEAALQVFLAFLLMYLLFEVCKIHKVKSITKSWIANYYDVDRKTLNKWILYFGKEAFPDYNGYLKQRKFTPIHSCALIYILGHPESFSLLTKKEIINDREGTYSSLRGCVKDYPELYGLSIEAFQNLKKFPPKVAEQIWDKYS
jgi:hypothetical protein